MRYKSEATCHPFSSSTFSQHTMLLLKIDCADLLLEVIYILNRFAESGNVECSPDLFSIAVTHHSLELNVAFQMMPEFFTLFFSHKSHVSKILLSPLYSTIRRMQHFNIPLAALYVLRHPERLNLKFTPPGWFHFIYSNSCSSKNLVPCQRILFI